jgi:hypothetical protein
MNNNVEKAIRAGMNCGVSGDSLEILNCMTSGSKSRSMVIIKGVAAHYIEDENLLNNEAEFLQAFDIVCAELSEDGCEVEWPKD